MAPVKPLSLLGSALSGHRPRPDYPEAALGVEEEQIWPRSALGSCAMDEFKMSIAFRFTSALPSLRTSVRTSNNPSLCILIRMACWLAGDHWRSRRQVLFQDSNQVPPFFCGWITLLNLSKEVNVSGTESRHNVHLSHHNHVTREHRLIQQTGKHSIFDVVG